MSPFPRSASRPLRAAALSIALLLLSGCGETYDLADLPPADATGSDATGTDSTGAGGTTATTSDPLAAPVETTADVTGVLNAMIEIWRGLGQRVVDGDRAEEALTRIEELWARVEPTLRRERPAALFGFEQAVDLARSAVERRRPADAGKGLSIMINATANLAGD